MENRCELWHYGVKGMRWGVRRYQNKDGSLTPAGKKKYNQELAKVRSQEKALKTSAATKAKIDKLNARKKAVEDQKKAAKDSPSEKPKRKSIKQMTDDELKEKISRLKLEQECKDLSVKTTSRGKKFVLDVLEQSGKNIAVQLTTYAMGSAVNKLAKEAGVKNGERTITNDDGTKRIERIFEDIVNPRKGQKDK